MNEYEWDMIISADLLTYLTLIGGNMSFTTIVSRNYYISNDFYSLFYVLWQLCKRYLKQHKANNLIAYVFI